MSITLKTGTDQAAGSEISETITALTKGLYAVRFRLVTSATVATRTVSLVIDDGTNILWQKVAGATQAASLTRDYVFTRGVTDGVAFDANNQIVMSLPNDFPILPNFRIRTITTNIQAGDNFAAPLLLVNEVLGTDDVVVAL
jgi:hypothetical protein